MKVGEVNKECKEEGKITITIVNFKVIIDAFEKVSLNSEMVEPDLFLSFLHIYVRLWQLNRMNPYWI